MKCRVRPLVLLLVTATLSLASGSVHAQAPSSLAFIVRWWSFNRFVVGNPVEQRVGDERVQVGGTVSDDLTLGPLVFRSPLNFVDQGHQTVEANEDGSKYSVLAEAPTGDRTRAGDQIGSSTELVQVQYFRKTQADATLRAVITRADLYAIDANAEKFTFPKCVGFYPNRDLTNCEDVMEASLTARVGAATLADGRTLIDTTGIARLTGWRRTWIVHAFTEAGSTSRFWGVSDFDEDRDPFDDEFQTGSQIIVHLLRPHTIEVPLSSVAVGDIFYVLTSVKAVAHNHRQAESYLGAAFRDPEDTSGAKLEFAGLEAIETPVEKPLPIVPQPAPACTVRRGPQAGKVRFARANFVALESSPMAVPIVVSRVNGSRGPLSVRLTAADGTAHAGSDYAATDTQVLFADGEEGDRVAMLPLVDDSVAEPDENVVLTLSDLSGCGKLGERSTAMLTILDNDQQVAPPATFSVGGTITGLAGSGLILQQIVDATQVRPTADGPFAFDTRLVSGSRYDVRVETQPTSPIQVCTVTNGAGTIGTADVTDIQVACVTPPPGGSTDPGFGSGGIVTVAAPPVTAMALQNDGRIVTVGSLTMTRFNADGTLDTSFGNGGSVPIVFNGGALDEAGAVAIQTDGRIVVAGLTRAGTDDFGVARFESDGTRDLTFGGTGSIHTDFAGNADRARSVLIQNDGRIVVVGTAARPSPLGGDSDVALARYLSDGTLDSAFGNGGKVMTDVSGPGDVAFAARLLPDDGIVVAGRIIAPGEVDPDVAVLRYLRDGNLDATFGNGGISVADLTGTHDWDEASGVAVQPDGRVVVSVQAIVGGSFHFIAARFDTGGHLDPTFGSGGNATITFSTFNDFARAVAVQEDGGILLVGQSSNFNNGNVALARLTPAGALDPSFGTNGLLTIDVFGDIDNAQTVALQPDARILVAGSAKNGRTGGAVVIRIFP